MVPKCGYFMPSRTAMASAVSEAAKASGRARAQPARRPGHCAPDHAGGVTAVFHCCFGEGQAQAVPLVGVIEAR